MIAIFLLAAASAANALVVQTQSGTVRGVDQGAELAWLGIPFAKPPVGRLRWRPPQPAGHWSGVFDASQFGNRCIQTSYDDQNNPFTDGSEDCLNLNIWVPKGARPRGGFPVMVWFFPGGNQFGDNRADLSALVDRGVIVVEPNYRLGIYGSFAHPLIVARDGGTSPNFLLQDQTLALRWVRRNISAFGGDADNVTIFGSSAGAVDLGFLFADPEARGTFDKAIISFGWPAGGTRLQDQEYMDAQAAQFVGCGPDVPDVVACMQAVPFEAWDDVLNRGIAWSGPTVDGMTVVEEPLFWLQEFGAGVPLLIGYNDDEGASFAGFDGNYDLTQPQFGTTQADLDAYLYDGIAPWLPYDADSARQFDQWYTIAGQTDPPPLAPPYATVYRAIAANVSDWLGMGMRYRERAAADNGGTVYSYVFTHGLEDPSSWIYDFARMFGATHMIQEVVYSDFRLWIGPYQPTAAEVVLADRMGKIWTNFARTGDPNGPGIPSWPRYRTSTSLSMILDDDMHLVSHFREGQDDLQQFSMLIDPWTAYFPFDGNGPCTHRFYCSDARDWLEQNFGPPPPTPYAPSWHIFQYPPTGIMLKAVGRNGWDSPP